MRLVHSIVLWCAKLLQRTWQKYTKHILNTRIIDISYVARKIQIFARLAKISSRVGKTRHARSFRANPEQIIPKTH